MCIHVFEVQMRCVLANGKFLRIQKVYLDHGLKIIKMHTCNYNMKSLSNFTGRQCRGRLKYNQTFFAHQKFKTTKTKSKTWRTIIEDLFVLDNIVCIRSMGRASFSQNLWWWWWWWWGWCFRCLSVCLWSCMLVVGDHIWVFDW